MSYLITMLLATSLSTPIPPLADKEGFDRCVAEVNANPELGGDSDYIHCDVQFDPYLVLYPEERWDDSRAHYEEINRAEVAK